jgi:pimeloyl-ACP methyl ester carboxylesterase
MGSADPHSGEMADKRNEPGCLDGAKYLVGALAIILGVFIFRPAPVTTFARVAAWQSMGSLVPVQVRDGSGASVEASVFVIDERPGDAAGLPLLFVHGFPTSSFDWKDVWPTLCHEAKRRCIALDLLGYGLSEKPSVNYSVGLHA